MSKKAQMIFNTYIMIFFRITIVLLVAISMKLFVYAFIDNSTDTDRVESEIFMQSLLNSPNGISYDDNRIYPGLIDIKQFKEADLDKAFFYEKNRFLAAKIELLDFEGNMIEEKIYNEAYYQIWYPMAITGGKGSASILQKIHPVQIISKGPGFIRSTILIPKS